MKFKYHIDRAPQLRISLFVCSYVLRETSFFGNYKTIENAAHRCCLIAVASDEFHSDVFILIGLDSLKDSMDCAFIIVIRLIQLTLSRRLVLLNKCDQIMHWFIRSSNRFQDNFQKKWKYTQLWIISWSQWVLCFV